MEGYPKTKYPKIGRGFITVDNPQQEGLLGDNWQDFPAHQPEPESIEKMVSDADRDLKAATGKFDKSLGSKEKSKSPETSS